MPIAVAISAAAAVLLLAGCDSGPAPVIRCGNDILTGGNTGFELTQRCGQPVAVAQAEGRPYATPVYDAAKSRHVLQFIPQPYEIWTYAATPDHPGARVSVKDGIITKIELLGEGK